MIVQHILNSKDSDAVVTVAPGTHIKQAAQVLAEKRIGSVIVSKDETAVDGILSERDIVRELARRGAPCLDDTVDMYMTTKLVTCSRADKADAILQQMTDGRFRHMPVVEEGKLIGLITIGDVVKARLLELSMEKDALEGMIKGF